jgi:hypothetical protein
MPIIPAGIVDKDGERAELVRCRINGIPRRCDVTQIGFQVEYGVSRACRQARRQIAARSLCQIDEGDAGALPDETFDKCRTDAGAAAGDHHAAIGKIRVSSRNIDHVLDLPQDNPAVLSQRSRAEKSGTDALTKEGVAIA